jgi:Derlin-2/3
MPNSIEDWYNQIPVVTRVYLTLAVVTTLLCALEIVSPFSLYFNWNAIVYKFELWRILTNFLFFGLFGIEYVFHMFFLVRYCRLLEENTFHGRTADFLFMLLFGGTIMTVLAPFLNVHFLGSALSFMLVYVWSYKNEHIQMSFLGLINFTAPYLPWVLLVFAVLLGASPVMDLLGLLAGHLYYFLEWEYPRIRGVKVLHTPALLRAVFEQDEPEILDQAQAAHNDLLTDDLAVAAVQEEEAEDERNPFAPPPAEPEDANPFAPADQNQEHNPFAPAHQAVPVN